jgi:hypothetical protein
MVAQYGKLNGYFCMMGGKRPIQIYCVPAYPSEVRGSIVVFRATAPGRFGALLSAVGHLPLAGQLAVSPRLN